MSLIQQICRSTECVWSVYWVLVYGGKHNKSVCCRGAQWLKSRIYHLMDRTGLLSKGRTWNILHQSLVKKQDITERRCSGQRIIQDKQVQRSERTQQPPLFFPLAATMRAVMVNVMGQPHWITGCLDTWLNITHGCICGRVSKRD